MENTTRATIQEEAKKRLRLNGYNGTICLSTGVGKTKISIDCIKEGNFKNVLITSPRTNLKENWRKELNKWDIIDASDVGEINSFKIIGGSFIRITIENIQTAYKWSQEQLQQFDLIIMDEIHTTGEEMSAMVSIARIISIPIIGLTATPNDKDDFKKDVLYRLVPILYEFYDSESTGITNTVKYWVYEYELTDNFQILAGNKTKQWFKGENTQYLYMDDVFESSAKIIKDYYWKDVKANMVKELKGTLVKSEVDREFLKDVVSQDIEYFYEKTKPRYDDRSLSIDLYYALKRVKNYNYSILGTNATRHLSNRFVPEVVKPFIIKYAWALNERKNILWSLNSSRMKALELKSAILSASPNNKILLFSELTEQASKLCKDSVHSKNGKTAKQIAENNKVLIEKFNSGEVNVLSSCLSLTLGLNLVGANYAIFESYSGSSIGSKQRVGRTHRLPVNDIANVIIILPKNTQAETWFQSAFGWIQDYKVITKTSELFE